MKNNILVLIVLVSILFSCSKDDDPSGSIPKIDYTIGYSPNQLNAPSNGAHPPLSQKWELVDVLTDEFEGNTINSNKWNNLHPAWTGRVPSKFKRENTTVGDGYLKLKSTSRINNMSEVADPENDIWIDAASMTSKAASAKIGYYYEASFKAANLSMVSSFWFRIGKYSEIDVIEHIGNATNGSENTTSYKYACNTHVYGTKTGAEKGATYVMPSKGRDQFHVYGLWWKDANNLIFYYNGKEVMKVTPSVPFEEDLYLIFDTEVFTWAGLPTISSLKDDSKNTMLVDFVRSYKITSNSTNNGLIKNGSFEDNETINWLWKGEVSLNTHTTNLNDGVFNVNLKNGGSIIQKINVNKNQFYSLQLNAKTATGNVKIEIINIAEKTITTSDWSSQKLDFSSGDNTEVYLKVTSSSNSNVFIDAFKMN